VGDPTLVDKLRKLVRGYDITTRTETLATFLECLSERKDRLWVAPLIDVLKYEEEAGAASLERGQVRKGSAIWKMKVATDPALYDHPLTLILPSENQGELIRVTQDRTDRAVYRDARGQLLVDVAPVDSTIILRQRTN
jgi:hypothetical protein